MKTIPFNVNDNVRVKLTPLGHKILLDDYLTMMLSYSEANRPFPYRAPKEDAEGWSTWQMWHLIQAFGPHVSMGRKNPFETNIQIEVVE